MFHLSKLIYGACRELLKIFPRQLMKDSTIVLSIQMKYASNLSLNMQVNEFVGCSESFIA
jgi:uncharacterized membrane protein